MTPDKNPSEQYFFELRNVIPKQEIAHSSGARRIYMLLYSLALLLSRALYENFALYRAKDQPIGSCIMPRKFR